MALIKKFDLSEIDYQSIIARKYNSGDYEDCIRTIRFVLDESDLEIDIVVVGIYLIKSYYNIGRYEEAFYELKLMIALGINNPELSILAMECMDKLGRLTTHKYFNYTNFDFVNDDFDDDQESVINNLTCANSSETDLYYRKQTVSSKIIRDLESRNNERTEKDFLSVINKEDSDQRLFTKFYESMSSRQYNEAIDLMNNALKKEPNDTQYMEYLILAYDCANQHRQSLDTAMRLMQINSKSALGAHSYLDACYKCDVTPDWEYINNFVLNYSTEDEFDLLMIAQTILSYRENLDLAQRLLDNNIGLRTSCYYLYICAYIAYRKQGIDAAVEFFKRIRALYGRRSFADEYIELVKMGKLTIAHACKMPKESVIKAIVNIDLLLRDENTKFSQEIVNNPSCFNDVKRILYSEEVDYAQRVLSKLDKNAVISVMWQLQELLLDDQKVLPAIKKIILFTLLSKVPTSVFFVGYDDTAEDIDAEEFMEIAEGDRIIEKAIIIALSRLYFKESAISVRLDAAIRHVKAFKDKTLLNNYKYLAELMLVDCWYYGLEFTAEEIATESSLRVKTMTDYLISYDNYSGKFKFPNTDEDTSNAITIKGDIEEILGEFASFIDKINPDSIANKPKLHVVKFKNEKIEEDNNGDGDNEPSDN